MKKRIWDLIFGIKSTMRRIRKNKIKQDTKLIKFFKNRATYILILFTLILFLFQNDKILNRPFYLSFILYLSSFGIIVLIFFRRLKKYRQFYIDEIKKFLFFDKVILFLGIALLVYVFQSILSIPLNFVIKKYANENSVEYYDCKIANVITTGVDKIHFIFLGRRYSSYYNVNGFTKNELVNNYNIELRVRQSIFSTYYIESMNLKKK